MDALELIVPAARPLGSAELAGLELVLLLASPIFAFFSTKPPPAAGLADGLALGLLLLSRCRQPVAVTCPAISLGELLVGWLLCGLAVGGLLGLGLGGG